MTTTIRLHSVTSTAAVPELGITECDFRGAKFVGDSDGDHHHTLFELDVDETDDRVKEALEFGPRVNALLAHLEHNVESGLPNVGGQIPYLRIGVWDKHAPH